MKNKPTSERGQALIFIALAIVGIIGMVGLAVDGGSVFSDRRHAQNAADTAAVAGALAKIQYLQSHSTATDTDANAIAAATVAGLNRALSNGYDNNLVTNTVEVHNPPVSGPYSNCATTLYDCNEYVQVIINSTIGTYFAKVVGIDQLRNKVESVALAKGPYIGPVFSGNALVSLKPTGSGCPGEFILGGSGTVNVIGGGIYVNSNNPSCSFNQNGCNTTLTMPNGSINMVSYPNANLMAGCLSNIQASFGATMQEPYPPTITKPMPAECSLAPAPYTYDSATKTATLFPGWYLQLPPPSTPGDKVILTPGNYCVIKVFKATNSLAELEGHGVFIYIQQGGDFDLEGGYLDLSAQTGPETNPYKNYLIYVAPDYSGAVTNCKINGNTNNILTGTIYAPHCNITINGDSSPTGYSSQIIGYTITLAGNNALYFQYDPNKNAAEVYPPQTGVIR